MLPPRKTSMHVSHQLNNSSIDTVNQAENFNKFFSVGEELANAASSHSDHDFRLYMKNRVIDTIYLEPPNTNEIANALLTLSVNIAMGHDNIPAFFLKVAPYVLTPYLSYLLDYAFNNGILPDNCKIAKIIPIHKNGDQSNPSNYRPISILTCFSKIIEKLIYKRLFSFISKNKTLSSHQCEFQKKNFYSPCHS